MQPAHPKSLLQWGARGFEMTFQMFEMSLVKTKERPLRASLASLLWVLLVSLCAVGFWVVFILFTLFTFLLLQPGHR